MTQVPLLWKNRWCFQSGRLVRACVTDLLERALDELLALFADIVIDGAHRLDGARGGPGEGELAVSDLALIQGEGSVAEDDETAVGEVAGFVFVEIEDDFFVREGIFADFHGVFDGNRMGPAGSESFATGERNL